MERTRLLPAYGLAAANAANEHALARRVLLVIAGTLALAATTAGTAAGLREVGPRDALASASAATTASQLVAWNEYSTFEEGKPLWAALEGAGPRERRAVTPERPATHSPWRWCDPLVVSASQSAQTPLALVETLEGGRITGVQAQAASVRR